MHIFLRIGDLLFLGALVWVAWADAREKRIANGWVICLFLERTFVLVLGCEMIRWVDAVGGFLLGGGVFFLIYWGTKGGIGAGDVKLLAVVGYFVGGEWILWVMFWAAFLAVIWGFLRGKRKERVALGPFVFLGTLFVMGMRGVV